jgi:hypothetical protein
VLPIFDEKACLDTSAKRSFCFLSADSRTSQNPLLATLQTLLLREHNDFASKLHALNPHWSDDVIYQVLLIHTSIQYHIWFVFIYEH